MNSRRIIVLLIGVVFLLQGCGAAERVALLEPPYEAVGMDGVRAAELWPVAARDGRVTVTDNGEAHDTSDTTVEVGPGAWRMRVGAFWVVDMVRDGDGEVAAVSEVESQEERRVAYDPPLPLLPSELRPGETIERTSTAHLYNHASGVLEASGRCVATYTLLGAKTVEPAAGGDGEPRVAYVVEVNRRYHMPLVVVDMRIQSAYVPGEGPIAGRTVRVVKLLGMIPVVHEQSVERVE